MFSNIWHKAGSINLLCTDLDKMQSEGNDYVFADCYLRPEKVVNYLEKNAGGLEINHVMYGQRRWLCLSKIFLRI